MNLKEFVTKYDGEFVEVGGSPAAVNQCVDLANAWIENLGLPKILGTNAIDFPLKANGNYQWILNSPEALPEAGDLMIFALGGYGHISIFVEGDLTSFTSFDQNYPLKSPCHLQKHYYVKSKVKGWLHPINLPVSETMTEEQKRILDFIGSRTEGEVRQAFGAKADLPNLIKEIESLKASYNALADRLAILESENKANNDLIVGYQESLKTANSRESKLQAELKSMSDEKNVWKNRYESKLQETVDKFTGWQLIKMGIKKLQVNTKK